MADKVSSVEKALAILDCFDLERSELGLAQICRMLATPKSTTLNQLRTLENMGYLFRSGPSRNYRLGSLSSTMLLRSLKSLRRDAGSMCISQAM